MKITGDNLFNLGVLLFLGFYFVFRSRFVAYITAKRQREAEEKEQQAFSDALEETEGKEE